MAKGTLQIAYDKLLLENLELKERIKELSAENKKLRATKCPPISDGDSCICPIEELERVRAGVRVSLIAMRTAVKKGGNVSEEQLKDLIDELKAK